MKRSLMVLSMMVILTACTSKFDGFDPTTATFRWIIKQNLNVEKDELQVKKNCQALNTSGGYIWGTFGGNPQYSSLCALGRTCTETRRVV